MTDGSDGCCQWLLDQFAEKDVSATERIVLHWLTAGGTTDDLLRETAGLPPLELLRALHGFVRDTMGNDTRCSRHLAQIALDVARRHPDNRLLDAQAHWSLGSSVFHTDFDQALEHYDQALHFYEAHRAAIAPAEPEIDVRIVEILRVYCLSELGRYDDALASADRAERWLAEHSNDDARLHDARLSFLTNRSQLAGQLPDYHGMIAFAEEARALAQERKDSDGVAKALINQVYAYLFLGEFEKAEALLDRAEAISEAERLTHTQALMNRAKLRRLLGLPFEALKVLEDASQGIADVENEAATIAYEQALVYEQIALYDEAYRAAARAARDYGLQMMPAYSAASAIQAARFALRQKRIPSALKQHAAAQEQLRNGTFPLLSAQLELLDAHIAALDESPAKVRAGRRRRAAVVTAIATLEQAGMKYEAVLGRLVLAALDARLGNRAAARAAYIDLTRTHDRQIRIDAYAGLGALLPPAEALPFLRAAAEQATEQRRLLPVEELQARYGNRTSPHHLRLAACLLELGDVEQAFAAVCVAKAGVLLDLRSIAGELDSDTQAQLEREKAEIATLRERQREHKRELQKKQVPAHAVEVQRAADEASDREHRLMDKLRTIGGRSGRMEVPAPAAVRAAIPSDVALLEYAVCGDRLRCFVVRANRPIVCRDLGLIKDTVQANDRWVIRLDSFLMGKVPASSDALRMALASFWTRLVAPLLDDIVDIKYLLIAPWDFLHQIPWGALFDGHYPGDAPTVALTICGGLLAAAPPSPTTIPGPPRLLGYEDKGSALLKHTGDELDLIERSFPHAVKHNPARSEHLRSAPAPLLLHIAAHGRINRRVPLLSALTLADGEFSLVEAHRLNLRGTQLVTLSACDTGDRPHDGDMVLSHVGAFLCAGAQAVVAALWPVRDEATPPLMDRFYTELARGVAPASALVRARRALSDVYPLDGAAFQLWLGARDMPWTAIASDTS